MAGLFQGTNSGVNVTNAKLMPEGGVDVEDDL